LNHPGNCYEYYAKGGGFRTLRIIVCIKQTPDTANERFIGPDLRMVRSGTGVENLIDPLAEHALEEALRIKDNDGSEVTLLLMGPEEAVDVIRRGLAMGADRAVHVSDPALAGSDAYATTRVLAAALKKMEWDMVLFGSTSADGQTASVPMGVAELLGVPAVTYVSKLLPQEGKVVTHRVAEDGYDVVEAALPALIGVIQIINEPRYPSLKGIMAAKKKPVEMWSLSDLGIDATTVGMAGAKTKVLSTLVPPPRGKGTVVKPESPEEAARVIADYLATKKIIG